jgi:hypothetical protein
MTQTFEAILQDDDYALLLNFATVIIATSVTIRN